MEKGSETVSMRRKNIENFMGKENNQKKMKIDILNIPINCAQRHF